MNNSWKQRTALLLKGYLQADHVFRDFFVI